MTTDVREGGEWSVGQRIKNDLLFALISLALAIATLLPVFITKHLGIALGLATWAFVPSWRKNALENITRALPEITEKPKFVRRTFRNLGEILGETVATLNPRRPLHPLPFAPGSREVLDAAIAEGRGVVFASAHLGPWERVAASLTMAGIPLTVVAREPYDPRLAKLYDRLRATRSVRTVYRGSSSAGIALARVLRKERGVLGIPMDLASRAESVRAPFFGIAARTAIGPARLAIRTNAAVVVGTVAPSNKGSLEISFTRIAGPFTTELDLTGRLNAALCQRIRALPSLWPWMHPRYDDPSNNGEKGRAREAGCGHPEVQARSDGWVSADPHRREADA